MIVSTRNNLLLILHAGNSLHESKTNSNFESMHDHSIFQFLYFCFPTMLSKLQCSSLAWFGFLSTILKFAGPQVLSSCTFA